MCSATMKTTSLAVLELLEPTAPPPSVTRCSPTGETQTTSAMFVTMDRTDM